MSARSSSPDEDESEHEEANEGEVPVWTESGIEKEQDVQQPPAKKKRAAASLKLQVEL